MEPNPNLVMILDALERTDVVELSEALQTPLASTIELVRDLERQGIVRMDRFGNIFRTEVRTSFKISGRDLSQVNDVIMSFLTTFSPDKFPKQRRLVQNQIDGMLTEWKLVQELMENEDDFITKWEPFAPVRDIEISFKHGEKILSVQVKSSITGSVKIDKSDCDRLTTQYGNKGYFAFKLGDAPFYLVSSEDVQKSEIREVNPATLISSLGSHYNVSTFREGVKNCFIPAGGP